jgi:hypothetical protein
VFRRSWSRWNHGEAVVCAGFGARASEHGAGANKKGKQLTKAKSPGHWQPSLPAGLVASSGHLVHGAAPPGPNESDLQTHLLSSGCIDCGNEGGKSGKRWERRERERERERVSEERKAGARAKKRGRVRARKEKEASRRAHRQPRFRGVIAEAPRVAGIAESVRRARRTRQYRRHAGAAEVVWVAPTGRLARVAAGRREVRAGGAGLGAGDAPRVFGAGRWGRDNACGAVLWCVCGERGSGGGGGGMGVSGHGRKRPWAERGGKTKKGTRERRAARVTTTAAKQPSSHGVRGVLPRINALTYPNEAARALATLAAGRAAQIAGAVSARAAGRRHPPWGVCALCADALVVSRLYWLCGKGGGREGGGGSEERERE